MRPESGAVCFPHVDIKWRHLPLLQELLIKAVGFSISFAVTKGENGTEFSAVEETPSIVAAVRLASRIDPFSERAHNMLDPFDEWLCQPL